jgi:hypothetical protein
MHVDDAVTRCVERVVGDPRGERSAQRDVGRVGAQERADALAGADEEQVAVRGGAVQAKG